MDSKQTEQARQIKQLLSRWQGKTLQITKEEDGDTDIITLLLHQVHVEDRPHTGDEYLPSCTVKLEGSGTIQNEDGEQIPIPYESYDIPLEEPINSHPDTEAVHIQTERASYHITCR
ncbi:hypothetical protein [Aneurinibacillus sp. REN35]|uniref:hypothetical protein n=1 Tax=Aneurinibacillus sp. REN35 TaxID=3237286 RepID=UPI003528E1C7